MTEGMARLRDTDPDRLGPFRVHGVLGSGTSGTVYLGRGAPRRGARKRTVAVRAVRAELLRDRQLRARVRKESAHVAASASSPFLAEPLGCELDSEQPWIASAFAPGHSVAALVSSYGPLPEMSVRALGGGVSRALAALHSAGTPHRDLRPANVLLTADGPRLVDFGPPLGGSVRWGGPGGGRGPQEAGGLDGSGGSGGARDPGGLGDSGDAGGTWGSGDAELADDVFRLSELLVYAATARSPFAAHLLPSAREAPELSGVPEALRPTLLDCLHQTPASRPRPAALARALDLSAMAERGADAWLPDPYLHDIDARADEARRLVGGIGGLFRR